MKKQKAIFLDIDDTVLDFLSHLCNIHNVKYGSNYSRYDIKEWALPEDMMKTFVDYKSWLFVSQPVLPKAKKKMQELYESDYKLVLITARDEEYRKHTEFNLAFNGIKYDDLYFNKNKSLKMNRLSDQYDIVVFADDKGSTVRNVADKTDIPNVYLINLPWNKSEEMPERVKRINSIADIKEVL